MLQHSIQPFLFSLFPVYLRKCIQYHRIRSRQSHHEMLKIHQYIIMCAPTMSQYAGLEALKNDRREDELALMRDAYDERRRVMVDGFRAMGLDCFEPQGAFYVFPSIQSTGLSSEEFCERLLYENQTAVVPGTAFGRSGEGFIRCSYAYSVESIRAALDRIEAFLKKLKME